MLLRRGDFESMHPHPCEAAAARWVHFPARHARMNASARQLSREPPPSTLSRAVDRMAKQKNCDFLAYYVPQPYREILRVMNTN
jgi:hypothetical protein